MEIIIYCIILLVLISWIYVIFIYNKPKKLTDKKSKYFEGKLKLIDKGNSSKEKIIDFDKLYHKILQEIWYKWDFWNILKLKPKEIDDVDIIWELHKLRNKLVHDFTNFDEVFLLKKQKKFFNEIEKLLNKLK